MTNSRKDMDNLTMKRTRSSKLFKRTRQISKRKTWTSFARCRKDENVSKSRLKKNGPKCRGGRKR